MKHQLLLFIVCLGYWGTSSAHDLASCAGCTVTPRLEAADAQSPLQYLDLPYLEFIAFVTQTSDTTEPIEVNQFPLADDADDNPYAFSAILLR